MTRKILTRSGSALLALFAVAVLAGCEPEVGTKAWCEKMDKKAKGDWSANEAGSYTKHCLIGSPKS